MEPMPAAPPLDGRLSYTVAESAQICGVTTYAIRRALAEGRLPYTRFGRTIVIDAESLREYVRSSAGRPVSRRHGIPATTSRGA